ncbi:MAG: hypothetical protein H7Z41_04765 [Cytophagales bacterium]|nr:hypothetical protein [Armatimonadota bacterium]
MKFWLMLLLGFLLVAGIFWLLAVAAGLLQYLFWAILISALIAGGVGYLLRARGLSPRSDRKQDSQQAKAAERELKQIEKRQEQEREKAR